jgi:ADP-glucose pyrophosphorylase
LEAALGGKTAKLTSSGMFVFDWTFLLNILAARDEQPKKILMNMRLMKKS